MKRLIRETYLSMIKNSVGSNLFRNFYIEENGIKRDAMENGDLSCAFFVSSILVLYKFIQEVHGTVNGTINDLKYSHWRPISKPRIGSVLVWEPIWEQFYGEEEEQHNHIGFYIGRGQAISNSSTYKTPTQHHWTFGTKNNEPVRKVETIFWNNRL
ncbi:MAG: hypothetical protein HY602_02825 [Parcubacteria group bacterium]|nr:hypothetical protein [Parcubacteria group bacterium]